MRASIEVRSPFRRRAGGTRHRLDGRRCRARSRRRHALYRNRRQWLPKQRRIAISAVPRFAIEVDRRIDGIGSCIEVLHTDGGDVIPNGRERDLGEARRVASRSRNMSRSACSSA